MDNYSLAMAENGRKGGLARGKKYLKKITEVIELFYEKPYLTQKELADEVGVSQAFVSKYVGALRKPYQNIDTVDQQFIQEQLQTIINHFELRSKLTGPLHKKTKINKV